MQVCPTLKRPYKKGTYLARDRKVLDSLFTGKDRGLQGKKKNYIRGDQRG